MAEASNDSLGLMDAFGTSEGSAVWSLDVVFAVAGDERAGAAEGDAALWWGLAVLQCTASPDGGGAGLPLARLQECEPRPDRRIEDTESPRAPGHPTESQQSQAVATFCELSFPLRPSNRSAPFGGVALPRGFVCRVRGLIPATSLGIPPPALTPEDVSCLLGTDPEARAAALAFREKRVVARLREDLRRSRECEEVFRGVMAALWPTAPARLRGPDAGSEGPSATPPPGARRPPPHRSPQSLLRRDGPGATTMGQKVLLRPLLAGEAAALVAAPVHPSTSSSPSVP
jgi:hypothetical protein